jgi:hypothetical protein
MRLSLLYIILPTLLISSCFEKDERVPPYGREVTAIADSVQMYQSYFDFETGRVVKAISSHAWQLGFECGVAGWHIITNSGAGWFIYNTGQTVPDAVVNMPGSVDNLFDLPSAFPDSTAVGNWVAMAETGTTYTHNMYLLGYYHGGKFKAIKQLAFLNVNDTAYRFFYKEMESGISDTVSIVKNDTVNYVYYNFEKHQQVSLEPDKTAWDLAFGPYYDLATLFGMTIPYQVGGSFFNVWQTEAVLDSINPFDAINLDMVSGYQFTSQRDIPGYRWKGVTVDVSGGGSATYAVKTHYNYIFHTAQNNYYKLKFLSYTLDGRSGFPRFEYSKLE